MPNWCLTRSRGSTGSVWNSDRSGSTAEDLHQVADLVVDLARVVDGRGDLLSDKFTVASAQAMDRNADGPLIGVEGGGRLGIRRRVVIAREVRLEADEGVGLARKPPFVFEGRRGAIEQGQGPAAIEKDLRRALLDGFGGVEVFGNQGVQVDMGRSAAAFLGMATVPLIGEVMVDGREEIGSEAAAVGPHGGELFLADEGEEDFLDDILGRRGVMSGAADKGVGRIPIGSEKGRHGRLCFGRTAGSRELDDTPMGGVKRGRAWPGNRRGVWRQDARREVVSSVSHGCRISKRCAGDRVGNAP